MADGPQSPEAQTKPVLDIETMPLAPIYKSPQKIVRTLLRRLVYADYAATSEEDGRELYHGTDPEKAHKETERAKIERDVYSDILRDLGQQEAVNQLRQNNPFRFKR